MKIVIKNKEKLKSELEKLEKNISELKQELFDEAELNDESMSKLSEIERKMTEINRGVWHGIEAKIVSSSGVELTIL